MLAANCMRASSSVSIITLSLLLKRRAWRSAALLERVGHADQHTADERRVAVEHRLRRPQPEHAALAQIALRAVHQLRDRRAGLRTRARAFVLRRLQDLGPWAFERGLRAVGRLAQGREQRALHLLDVRERLLDL